MFTSNRQQVTIVVILLVLMFAGLLGSGLCLLAGPEFSNEGVALGMAAMLAVVLLDIVVRTPVMGTAH